MFETREAAEQHARTYDEDGYLPPDIRIREVTP
jgi:hypothetical protein